MSDIAFGIDLGTSTSVISYIKDGRPVTLADPQTKSPLVPSIVGKSKRGELLVGQEADERSLPDQKVREAKRSMGTEDVFQLGEDSLRAEDVAALVLRKIKDNAEISLGVAMDQAVITVPAYFDDLPRRATEQAAILAGIRPLRLISEPVAAAMAYGIDKLDDEAMLLVFDFGGGTLDVTILDMMSGVLEVIATDGDKALGGKDMDDALINLVLQKTGQAEGSSAAMDSLKIACERAKKSLSSSQVADIFVPSFAMTPSGPVDVECEITRAEFEAAIQPLLDRAIQKVVGSLEKAKIPKERIERLLLVGGSCYVPKVREIVESFFGKTAEIGVDPDLAVSQGAAISAGLKLHKIDSTSSIVIQDASAHRLGTSAISRVGEQDMLMFSELMPPNAAIPFVRTMRYSLTRLTQDEVAIDVLQDLSGKAIFAADATPTGAVGVISDIPPSTTDVPRELDVEFRMDESQIIRITGKIIGLDRTVTIQLNSSIGAPFELGQVGLNVEALWEKSPLASRNTAIIRRAEVVLLTNPANSEIIEAALSDLKLAVANNDTSRAQGARERLTDQLAEVND